MLTVGDVVRELDRKIHEYNMAFPDAFAAICTEHRLSPYGVIRVIDGYEDPHDDELEEEVSTETEE